MQEKIKLGDIRRDLMVNIEVTKENKLKEKKWPLKNSSLANIGSSFSKVIPEEYVGTINQQVYSNIDKLGEGFKKYIEETLSKSENKERTAIEFGGPGSRLFSDFTKKFFKKTVGICLKDTRQFYNKMIDNRVGHSVITGDITDTTNKELYTTINKQLNTEKVDLIISRMMKPLDYMKKNPALLDKIIRKWYSLLNKNGMLFVQFEFFLEHNPKMENKHRAEVDPQEERDIEINVKEWVKLIEKRFPNEIEIKLGRGIIHIHKKENAPEELPPARELSI